jgi:hypothetical protein
MGREIESRQGISRVVAFKRKKKTGRETRKVLEPILRLVNLQLQRWRCSRLDRFSN